MSIQDSALISEVRRRLPKHNISKLDILLKQKSLNKINLPNPPLDNYNKKVESYIEHFIKENSSKFFFRSINMKRKNLSELFLTKPKFQTIRNQKLSTNNRKFFPFIKDNVPQTPYQIKHLQIQHFRQIINNRAKRQKYPDIHLNAPSTHRSVSVNAGIVGNNNQSKNNSLNISKGLNSCNCNGNRNNNGLLKKNIFNYKKINKINNKSNNSNSYSRNNKNQNQRNWSENSSLNVNIMKLRMFRNKNRKNNRNRNNICCKKNTYTYYSSNNTNNTTFHINGHSNIFELKKIWTSKFGF